MEITKKDVVNLVKAKTDLSVKTTSEVVAFHRIRNILRY